MINSDILYIIYTEKIFFKCYLKEVRFMRKTAFIISEYNPFHNGHKYHIEKTREAGADTVIAVMSGNFVQRGEIAFCDKMFRTQAAVKNGVDLVIENPVKYVLSGASFFALGAMNAIRNTGIEGTLSFGASANPEELTFLADLLSDEEIINKITAYSLQNGSTYAFALQKIAEAEFSGAARILSDPNNILALEYIKAAKKTGLNIDFFCLKRTEVLHDQNLPAGNIASAKFIRDEFSSGRGENALSLYTPENIRHCLSEKIGRGELPPDRGKFSSAVMSRLLTLTAQELEKTNGVSAGLENRIIAAVKETAELENLYDSIKTKKYTHARIRQIILSAALGIEKADLDRENPYMRVLGFHQKGRGLLGLIRQNAGVPVIMNLSEAPQGREREIDYLSGKIYDICRPVPWNRNAEYVSKPYVAE